KRRAPDEEPAPKHKLAGLSNKPKTPTKRALAPTADTHAKAATGQAPAPEAAPAPALPAKPRDPHKRAHVGRVQKCRKVEKGKSAPAQQGTGSQKTITAYFHGGKAAAAAPAQAKEGTVRQTTISSYFKTANRNTAAQQRQAALTKALKEKHMPLPTGGPPQASPGCPSENDKPERKPTGPATPPPPMPPSNGLKCIVKNVMGGTTVERDMEDVRRKHRPAIMIYTELKLTSRQKAGNYLQRLFQRSYTIEYSFGPAAARPPGDKSRQREGTAGVAICVSKKHATPQTLECLTPPGLQGYVAHIRLASPQGRPLEVVGVYLPGDDKAKQTLIYDYTSAAAERCKKEGTTLLVGGDFNASLFPEDRSSGQTRKADKKYQQFVSETHLCPLTGWEANRQHTYWQKRASPSASSRIDDLLVCLETLPTPMKAQDWQPCTHDILIDGDGGDHDTLMVEAPCHILGYSPPPTQNSPPMEPRRRLTPTEDEKRRLASALATSADLDSLTQTLGNAASQWRQASEQALASTLATLECEDQYPQALAAALEENEVPLDTADRLAAQLQDCLAHVHKTALETCTTTTVSGTHTLDKQGPYLSRSQRKKYEAIMHKTRLLHLARRIAQDQAADQDTEKTLDILRSRLQAAVASASASPARALSGCPTRLVDETLDSIQSTMNASDKQGQEHTPHITLLAAIDEAHHALTLAKNLERRQSNKARYKKAQAAFNSLLAKNPKEGHRRIFGQGLPAGTQPLESLRHPTTKAITNDPKEKLEILHWLHQSTAKSVQPKTGTYQFNGIEEYYPHDKPLNHQVNDSYQLQSRAQRRKGDNMLHQIQNYNMFRECVSHLANRKATGWDEIPNELIRCLPEPLLRSIHSMFVTMWIMGRTPTAWKMSDTVLLYKKGDPTDAKNYRPVGLLLTIYKLWTTIITMVLVNYAEQHGCLSTSQEGFRRQRSTMRQIHIVMNALEDAAMMRQDVYLLFVDFSSAFNTINHDQLLQTMCDLGFTHDAVRVIRDLYTGAQTRIKTPFGTSDPIDFERGTIQGDSLSPFLFLICIEPLLRWLHVGGRGYKHGCIVDERERLRTAATNPAFADDLAILTNNLRDLCTQADKISKYLEWSGLQINPSKCAVTGMLHADPGQSPLSNKTVRMLLDRLATSCIQTLIAYSLPTGAYTSQDIARLDSLVASCAKRAMHLPSWVPNAMIHEDRDKAGVGVTSMLTDYVQGSAAALTRVLQQHGLPVPDNRIARRHKVALNRLSLLLNATPITQPSPHTHTCDKDLPFERRVVKASSLFCDTSLQTYPAGAPYKNGQTTLDAHIIQATSPTGAPDPPSDQASDAVPSASTLPNPLPRRRTQRPQRKATHAPLREVPVLTLKGRRETYKKAENGDGFMYMDRVHRWARLHSKHNLITEFYEREPIDQIVYQVTKGGAHKKPRTAAATYYGVRWADSVVMPHHLPHFADWNYHPKSTQRCPSKLYGQAGRKLLLLVGWKESEEPSTDLPPLLIDQFKTRQAQLGAPPPPPPPRDAALPPLERQGVVDNPPFAWPTAWQAQEVLNRITLSTDPVHPDKDIAPTGEYTFRVERYPAHAETSPLEGRAHVYDRAGHWLGKITLEQLINLRTRFERTHQRDPKLFAKLNCACDRQGFATELALLLQRWQASAKSLSEAALRQQHGTAHPRIV
ncbi:hypothetical protein N2152v2_003355, partial [Parachlorella kessleri]